MFLFGEHMRAGTLDLAAEAAGLALVVAGVAVLSHSHLVQGENAPPPARPLRSGRAARPAGPIAACTPGSSPRANHPGRASASLPLTPARPQPRLANFIGILYSYSMDIENVRSSAPECTYHPGGRSACGLAGARGSALVRAL